MRKIGSTVLWDVNEVAKHLNTHAETVKNYIRQGKLKAKKFGRSYLITEEAIREYFGIGNAVNANGSNGNNQDD